MNFFVCCLILLFAPKERHPFIDTDINQFDSELDETHSVRTLLWESQETSKAVCFRSCKKAICSIVVFFATVAAVYTVGNTFRKRRPVNAPDIPCLDVFARVYAESQCSDIGFNESIPECCELTMADRESLQKCQKETKKLFLERNCAGHGVKDVICCRVIFSENLKPIKH